MIDNTREDEKSKRVQRYLNNLDNFSTLYEQFILSEIVENEKKRRSALRSKARRLLREYEDMSEEEQEKFEERRNKDGYYSKDKLEEIADKEELIPEDKLEELNIPTRYVSSDIEARSVDQVRKIMTYLMDNYDPVGKEAPNWSKTKRQLREEHDIRIDVPKLKRYWSAIEDKEAFSLVKQKMYWDIVSELEGVASKLIDHVLDRVGSEGGEYDSIDQRIDAVVKIADMIKDLPSNKPEQEDKPEGGVITQNIRFDIMDEADRRSDDEASTIDITGEENES